MTGERYAQIGLDVHWLKPYHTRLRRDPIRGRGGHNIGQPLVDQIVR